MTPAVTFHPDHLNAFAKSVAANHDPNDGGGKVARTFAAPLTGISADRLPPRQVSRDDVFSLVADVSFNTATVCAAIMAWGGMRMNHRDMLFGEASQQWVGVSEKIRNGHYDRRTAYEAFVALQRENKLPGAGPAYFTKLIYFLMPRSDGSRPSGYIMDQWAGCSINLLAGSDTVRMNSIFEWVSSRGKLARRATFIVSDTNDGSNYEAFCSAVDALATHFGISGDATDRALLSTGGRNAEAWRQYVIEHRTP